LRKAIEAKTSVNGSVSPNQRFTPNRPCPICGGCANDRRGHDVRCYGFLSRDGEWAHCTRPEHAGQIEVNSSSSTYAHPLKGECSCGQSHGLPQKVAPNSSPKPKRKKIVATYDYADEGGQLRHQTVRYEPKGFKQRQPKVDNPDPHNGAHWVRSLEGMTPVLYRLPDLLAADPTQPVFIVEGEKDVDRAYQLGLVATTCAMGAGKWRDVYSASLRARHVVILPDNDQPGRDHAEQVALSLHGIAASVRILHLPGLPDGGDLSDWLELAGNE